jgi:UDP-galactopyranose mutase
VAILWKGISVTYPFQANLGVLQKEVVRECLLGFIKSLLESRGEKTGSRKMKKGDFHSWIIETLGEGIARHFMIPYNQKMWHVGLEEMTDDWVGWSVPKPTLEEVLDGVLGIQGSTFGYNAEFYYPAEGGIESVPKALFDEIVRFTDPLLAMEVKKIDLDRRLIYMNDGKSLGYTQLISTIPLPVLLKKAERLSPSTSKAGRNLRSVGVMLFNIGLSRPPETDLHWIYLPEKNYPFFRAGVYSNFSKSLVPRGCGSLYVEVSYPTGKKPDQGKLLKQVLDGLMDARLISDEKDVATINVQDMAYGYVIFDHYRRANLQGILSELESKGVYSIGRYGAWDYLTMEGAILQGKSLAERLRRKLK